MGCEWYKKYFLKINWTLRACTKEDDVPEGFKWVLYCPARGHQVSNPDLETLWKCWEWQAKEFLRREEAVDVMFDLYKKSSIADRQKITQWAFFGIGKEDPIIWKSIMMIGLPSQKKRVWSTAIIKVSPASWHPDNNLTEVRLPLMRKILEEDRKVISSAISVARKDCLDVKCARI
jgi:hypothetical protein